MIPNEIKLIVPILFCAIATIAADDFKTIDGKEYRSVRVSRVEPDGIVVITNSGISKIYFTELPKEVQERFHFDASKAAAYSSDQAAKQEAFRKQQEELQRKSDLEKQVARSKADAVALYPGAGKPGSALDQAIQERMNWIAKNQPDLFQDPTWPMHVTRNAAECLAAAQPQQTATPWKPMGTMLDQHPSGTSIQASHDEEVRAVQARTEIMREGGHGPTGLREDADLEDIRAFYLEQIGAAKAAGKQELADAWVEQATSVTARWLGKRLRER